MHPFPFKGVQICCRNAGEGLAFTGFHLQDFSLMEYDCSHNLYIIVPLTQNTLGGFPGQGESLGQQTLQGGSFFQLLPELCSLNRELVIGQR